jgi:hypothetical protein
MRTILNRSMAYFSIHTETCDIPATGWLVDLDAVVKCECLYHLKWGTCSHVTHFCMLKGQELVGLNNRDILLASTVVKKAAVKGRNEQAHQKKAALSNKTPAPNVVKPKKVKEDAVAEAPLKKRLKDTAAIKALYKETSGGPASSNKEADSDEEEEEDEDDLFQGFKEGQWIKMMRYHDGKYCGDMAQVRAPFNFLGH